MAMHPTIGKQFREARERKGMSLSAAAETTRIKPTQIQAMEQGDFSSMAAPLYVKGFIRIYAKVLGLDAREIIDQVMTSPAGAPALAPENTSRMLHTRHAPSPALAPPVDRFAPPGEDASAVVSAPPAPEASGPRTRSTVHVPRKTPPPPPPPSSTSILARRLTETQRIINESRPPAEAPPAKTPDARPGPAAGEFDFPDLSPGVDAGPSRRKGADRRKGEPDLFAYRASPPRSPGSAEATEASSPGLPSAAGPAPAVPSSTARGPTSSLTAGKMAKYWGRLRTAWLPVYGPPMVIAALLLVAAAGLTSVLKSCTAERAIRPPVLGPAAPSGYAVEPPDPYLIIEPGPVAPRAP